MRVRAIMLPYERLSCIEVTDTIRKAIEIINEQELLSLPVVDGQNFVGVLSKQFVFESYFECDNCSKEEFLDKKVQEFMKTKIDTIAMDMRIEEAAAKFITSKVRFIPITDEQNHLMGIITQQAVFKQYQKMFGHKHNSLVVYSYDSRGTLAKMCEVIAKAGGDIRNMLVMHTDVMNLVEIFLRIDAEDFDKVVKSLIKHKFDVRDVEYVQGGRD